MWWKASDAGGRAGFMLLEVLVALVVAGLFLGVLAHAFAAAWNATRRPRETVAAMTVARAVAQMDTPHALPDEGAIDGYAFRRTIAPVEIDSLPSRLAPAPAEAGPATGTSPGSAGMPVPVDTMPGVSDVGPASTNPAPAPAPRRLRRIIVVVTAPSGRRTRLETVRFALLPN